MKAVGRYIAGFFFAIFVLLEWVAETLLKLISVIHDAIKDVAIALETIKSGNK